jgi:DNA-binding IclR family transcriptional regulator
MVVVQEWRAYRSPRYLMDVGRLGMRLFELGRLVPRRRGLLEAAAPFLADLFEATHETVHLAVPDGAEVSRDRLAPAVRTAALGVSRVLGVKPAPLS